MVERKAFLVNRINDKCQIDDRNDLPLELVFISALCFKDKNYSLEEKKDFNRRMTDETVKRTFFQIKLFIDVIIQKEKFS